VQAHDPLRLVLKALELLILQVPALDPSLQRQLLDRSTDVQAIARLLQSFEDALPAEPAQQPLQHPRQPLSPEAQQVALRCAHAVAELGCANLRCTNLAADPGGRGRRCSGFRLVRYCSEACSRADWAAHKATCRLLQREQQG
jgi:hypothetical protein